MVSISAGAEIKRLRTQKAWTQEKLAAAADLSPRTIQRAEEGQMSADSLSAIADALGVPVESISVSTNDRVPRITPVVYYERPDSLEWLAEVFGFQIGVRIPDQDGRIVHAELSLDDARLMVGQPVASRNWTTPERAGLRTQSLYVTVTDVDAHFEHARSLGAEILSPPEDMHGDRRYLTVDPEGHHWWFVTPIAGAHAP